MNGGVIMSASYQHEVGAFVNREVIECVSGVVYAMSQHNPDESFDWYTGNIDLQEAWMELDLWYRVELLSNHNIECPHGEEISVFAARSNEAPDIDIHYYEHVIQDLHHDYAPDVYEHWSVTEWLGERLEEQGEKVIDFYGLTVWCRTCTGQAILLDGVIQNIYNATQAKSA
jgi:hypothetical protein